MHVKNFTMVSVPEAATRLAMLERGEADIIHFVPGELIDRVKNNPKLILAPIVSGNWWLEFPGFQNPKNPFHDKRVRQAVSLAIDREAINQAESGGMGLVDGNWIKRRRRIRHAGTCASGSRTMAGWGRSTAASTS